MTGITAIHEARKLGRKLERQPELVGKVKNSRGSLQWMDEISLKFSTSKQVYFITFGPRKYIKIGSAKNVERRMGSLQIGIPYELELINSFKAPTRAEHWLHWLFESQRVRGEWFLFDDKIEYFLASARVSNFYAACQEANRAKV